MKEWTLNDLKKEYKIDLNEVVELVKSNNAKFVLLQFPDGLKQYSTSIVDYLKTKTNAEYFIYFGTCFGACDIPENTEKFGFDLLIQFGHTPLLPNY